MKITKKRSFEHLSLVVVVLSLITFTLTTVSSFSLDVQKLLKIMDNLFIMFFVIEYALRVIEADNKKHYILSFYGIVDFLTIIPFYAINLQGLKALRLLRILKLLRYTHVVNKFTYVWNDIKEDLIVCTLYCIILLYLASTGIYYCEKDVQPDHFGSIISCLWWAITTLTTVGYGDTYPITVAGKVFTAFIVIIGVGIVSLPTGLITSSLLKKDKEK